MSEQVTEDIWASSDDDSSLADVPNLDLQDSSLDKNNTSVEAAVARETASGNEDAPAAKTAGQEAEDATAETEEKSDEEPKAKTPPASIPAAKTYSFKVNGKDVALDETATVEHKVDGKKVAITVKDLLTNYAGTIPLNKRFSELDVERKKLAQTSSEFESKQVRYGNLLKDMHSHITGGRLFQGVANLLELAGSKVDPRQFVSELRKGLIEQAQQMATMSEHERALAEEREAREYTQSRYERLLAERDERAAQAAHHEAVTAEMARIGATMEEYAETKAFLEQAKKSGQFRDEITPTVVANLIKDTKIYQGVRKALTDAGFDYSKEQQLERDVAQLAKQHPEWTEDDLRDVVSRAATFKRGTSASQKIAKAPVATVVAAAAKAKSAAVTAKQKARENAMLQDPSKYGDFSAEDKTW